MSFHSSVTIRQKRNGQKNFCLKKRKFVIKTCVCGWKTIKTEVLWKVVTANRNRQYQASAFRHVIWWRRFYWKHFKRILVVSMTRFMCRYSVEVENWFSSLLKVISIVRWLDMLCGFLQMIWVWWNVWNIGVPFPWGHSRM